MEATLEKQIAADPHAKDTRDRCESINAEIVSLTTEQEIAKQNVDDVRFGIEKGTLTERAEANALALLHRVTSKIDRLLKARHELVQRCASPVIRGRRAELEGRLKDLHHTQAQYAEATKAARDGVTAAESVLEAAKKSDSKTAARDVDKAESSLARARLDFESCATDLRRITRDASLVKSELDEIESRLAGSDPKDLGEIVRWVEPGDKTEFNPNGFIFRVNPYRKFVAAIGEATPVYEADQDLVKAYIEGGWLREVHGPAG